MFTSDSKLVLGIGALLAVVATAYAIGSGDRVGAIVLATGAASAALLGVLLVGRVTPATAELVAPAPNRASEPLRPTLWPMLSAAAVVLFVVGVTVDVQTIVFGLVAVVVAGVGWFVQALRERRPQADPAAVYADERVIGPAGLPMLAFLAIAVVVISVSRILLAVSKSASVVVAIVAAGAVFGAAMFISSRRAVSGRALGALLALCAVLLVAGGVVAATEGERAFERHAGDASATEVARGTAFLEQDLVVETETERVRIRFVNEDVDVIHNIAFFTDDSAKEQVYFGGALLSTGEVTYTFAVPGAGEYFYRCEFHPEQMTGTLTVEVPANEDEEQA